MLKTITTPICEECGEKYGLELCMGGWHSGMKCSECGEEKDLYNISLSSSQIKLFDYLNNY